jgi:uncharacterized DUF497 family protein
MLKGSLSWDADRIDHIASHGVDIDEVLEVFYSDALAIRAVGGKMKLYGQTDSGRYLLVIVGRRRYSRHWWLVTARDMTDQEKRFYRQRRR